MAEDAGLLASVNPESIVEYEKSVDQIEASTAHDGQEESEDDDEPPEITLDSLSEGTLAALKAHLAIRDATEVKSSLARFTCPVE